MSDEMILCPDCRHPVRRHSSCGCMAAAGACACVLSPAEMQGSGEESRPITEPAAEEPSAAVEPEPAPVPEPDIRPRFTGSRSPVETVLARAVAAGGMLAKRAERIREQIIELDTDVANRQAVIDQERHVEALRAELATATEELKGLRSGKVPTKAAQRGDRSTQLHKIRAWAWAHGHECARNGQIPAQVMDAYRAAHPEMAA